MSVYERIWAYMSVYEREWAYLTVSVFELEQVKWNEIIRRQYDKGVWAREYNKPLLQMCIIVSVSTDHGSYDLEANQNKNNCLVKNFYNKFQLPALLFSVQISWVKSAGDFNLSSKLLTRQLFLI